MTRMAREAPAITDVAVTTAAGQGGDAALPRSTTAHHSEASSTALSLTSVSVAFGNFTAVDSVDLEVRDGEFLCLLGPSGCGKSTLLSVMAGFHGAATGEVTHRAVPVVKPTQEMGFVFQSTDALFDWMTVEQNIGFGPRMAGMAKKERAAIIEEHLQLVGLGQAGKKRPPQLSGGMRQRVQIARVLANAPDTVLMDEPFGALDAQTRTVMQRELDRIWRERRSTVVFVTHDIDEALVLADRIAIMTAGPRARIKSVYDVDLDRPRDEDSADFVALRHRVRDDIIEEVAKSMGDQARGDLR